jgi:protein pelota
MKIITRDRKKNFIKLTAESVDDLWHLKHIIREGDLLEGKTFRREEQRTDTIRTQRAEKKPVYLKLTAEKVEFHKNTNRLRITGVIEEGEDAGSYHTFNVEEGTTIGITKEWKRYDLERVEEAVAHTHAPKILIVTMDRGEAELGLVRGYGVDFLANLNELIPGKYYEVKRKKEQKAFFQTLAAKIVEVLERYVVEKVIIAGPGFAKEEFAQYLQEKYPQLDGAYVIKRASSVGRTGIYEVIKKGDLEDVYKESRLSREIRLVEELCQKVLKDEAVYGPSDTEKAVEFGAVETLLLLDERLHEEQYENLMDKARARGSEIYVISSEHEGGEKLQSLGGVAGLLRFKIF